MSADGTTYVTAITALGPKESSRAPHARSDPQSIELRAGTGPRSGLLPPGHGHRPKPAYAGPFHPGQSLSSHVEARAATGQNYLEDRRGTRVAAEVGDTFA